MHLAGCGLFGEISCHVTRRVGLYWRDALEATPSVASQKSDFTLRMPSAGIGRGFTGHVAGARDRDSFEDARTAGSGTLVVEKAQV
jgi:hypothetical protein